MGFDSEIPPTSLWTGSPRKKLDFTRLVLCLREHFMSGTEVCISLRFLELVMEKTFFEQQEKRRHGLIKVRCRRDMLL